MENEIYVGAYVEVDTGSRLGERGTVQDIRDGMAFVEFDDVPGDDFEIAVWKLILV